jgi:hypothetical protein
MALPAKWCVPLCRSSFPRLAVPSFCCGCTLQGEASERLQQKANMLQEEGVDVVGGKVEFLFPGMHMGPEAWLSCLF